MGTRGWTPPHPLKNHINIGVSLKKSVRVKASIQGSVIIGIPVKNTMRTQLQWYFDPPHSSINKKIFFLGIIKRRKKPEKECCNNMTCRYTSVENTLQLAADDVTIIVSAAEPLPKENLKGAVSAPNGTLPTDEEKQYVCGFNPLYTNGFFFLI